MERPRIGFGIPRFFQALFGTQGARVALAGGIAALLAVGGVIWGASPAHAAADVSFTQTVSGTAVVGQNLTFSVVMTNVGSSTISEGIEGAPPVGPEASLVSVRSASLSCARVSAGAIVLCQSV